MPELTRIQTASRSAFLDLQDEQRLVNDGYEFLDEKRILLAAELLRQRTAWREARGVFMERWQVAATALPVAAADQGLEGLQVHPRYTLDDARLDIDTRPCVGQVMLEAGMVVGATSLSRPPVRPSPDVLMLEYRRTERRVRALENVVLPEIRQDLAAMEEHLDLNDQEEVIRVRSLRAGSSERSRP